MLHSRMELEVLYRTYQRSTPANNASPDSESHMLMVSHRAKLPCPHPAHSSACSLSKYHVSIPMPDMGPGITVGDKSSITYLGSEVRLRRQ